MKKVSIQQEINVVQLLKSGCSYRDIQKRCSLSLSTISIIKKKNLPTKKIKKNGRPKILTDRDCSNIIRKITSGEIDTAAMVARLSEKKVSRQTVARILKKAGLKAMVKVKKPLLSKRNIKARLEFAKKHQYWTLEDWKRVIWSDETKINRFGSDGRKWCWKSNGKVLNENHVQSTVKFGGGSIMLWGCMTYQGAGYATKIDGGVNGEIYRSILDDELVETANRFNFDLKNMVFQQDNAPCHKAKATMEWFKSKQVEVMDWPPQSPDLNPIEHLWVHIKNELSKYEAPPSGIYQLWERTQEVWNRIPVEVCQNLIKSMPRRIQEVIDSRGGHTKY